LTGLGLFIIFHLIDLEILNNYTMTGMTKMIVLTVIHEFKIEIIGVFQEDIEQ